MEGEGKIKGKGTEERIIHNFAGRDQEMKGDTGGGKNVSSLALVIFLAGGEEWWRHKMRRITPHDFEEEEDVDVEDGVEVVVVEGDDKEAEVVVGVEVEEEGDNEEDGQALGDDLRRNALGAALGDDEEVDEEDDDDAGVGDDDDDVEDDDNEEGGGGECEGERECVRLFFS